jgi:pimeloyl-ACP methyl ester carboxylesterase
MSVCMPGRPEQETTLDSDDTSTAARAPELRKLLLEVRAPFEFAAGLLAAPWLLRAPRGDAHPVRVYPGFLATDFSTRPLRRLLRALGHDAVGWGQGRNLGPGDGTFETALQRLHELHRDAGRKVSLVGWSLGGLYARELAKLAPDAVRCVVTLGSPFAGPPRANRAWRLFEQLNRRRPNAPPTRHDLQAPPPVPTTSIFSRSDGIVAWPCSVEAEGPLAENIEVAASHIGLGVNPLAMYALADRLAQPEGAWRPFEPHGIARHLYRGPQRSTPASR